MRKFKFILWCEKTKTMSSPMEYLHQHRLDKYGYIFVDINNEHTNCIPMIYLGYNDKNGREVYQDFILKVNRQNYSSGHKYTEIVLAPDKVTQDWINMLIDFEIIGNLYQNPEMLRIKD